MKTIRTVLTAGAITACSLSLGFAQQQPGQPTEQSPQSEQQKEQQKQEAQQQSQQQQEFGARSSQANHQKATELKGSTIETQDGQELGTVEDIAVDLQTGQISFILASSESGGDQWVPVPPTAVQVQKQGGETTLSVDIEQQKWQEAPTVSKNEIAQLDQQQRAREIYQHFGENYQSRQQQSRQFGAPDRPEQPGGQQQPSQQSTTQQGQSDTQSSQMGTQSRQSGASAQSSSEFGAPQRSQGPKLASKLMEAKVDAPDQEEAARISDMILNLQDGFVDLVLIESEYVDGTFGVVPQAFEVIQEDQLRLNVSQEDLEQAQQLQMAQVGQRAQQARMASTQQTRQNPEVYRIQEGQESVFGAPQSRDSKEDSKKMEKSKASESKPGEPEASGY